MDEASVARMVSSRYGLAINSISQISGGADIASAVYRLETSDSGPLLLKSRKETWFNPASLLVPAFLSQEGVSSIISPLKDLSNSYWVKDEDLVWSITPFIEGQVAAEVDLNDVQWGHLGTVLRRIHDQVISEPLSSILPQERFKPSRVETLPSMLAWSGVGSYFDSLQEEMAICLQSQHQSIQILIKRSLELGQLLRREHRPIVLCHADFHVWNILVDQNRELWIVDWDETMWGLKERDLMFVIGSLAKDLVKDDESKRFMDGYGDTVINMLALTYYRIAWALQDIAAFGEKVLHSDDLTQADRRDALDSMVRMFSPGNVVDIALLSDGLKG